VINDPINLTDPLGLWTFGAGLQFQGGLGGGGGFSFGGFIGHNSASPWYSGWSAGLLGTGEAGLLAGAGDSVSVFGQWSNNSSVCKLKGAGWDVGASGGEGVNIGADASGSVSLNPNTGDLNVSGPTAWTGSLGLGGWAPVPAEAHGFGTYTNGWTWGSTQ